MIRINDVVEELGDDVFIRQSKSMSNNELSIEQLQAANGGVTSGGNGVLCFTGTEEIDAITDAKKKDLLAERTFAWLAAPWKKVKAVGQSDIFE